MVLKTVLTFLIGDTIMRKEEKALEGIGDAIGLLIVLQIVVYAGLSMFLGLAYICKQMGWF